MKLTSLVRPYFNSRYRKTLVQQQHPAQTQRQVLRQLIAAAATTQWGREHGFGEVQSYEDFARFCPITDYEDLKSYIDRMRHGEKDVLWPGMVRWYAKSSGTTNDKSKFIPVSRQGLRDTHYAGGTDCVAYYLHSHPESRLFDGRALILGGSHEQNYDVKESLVGDLSAILIENINPLANLVRTPGKRVALLENFDEKRDRIARIAMKQHVTNISGVPSWMQSVLTRMLELTGAKDVSEVWPDCEVFFHGGVAFTPYRETYRELFPSKKMHYMETYNASEGFFGLQTNPADTSMELMVGYGVFYEFIPMSELGMPDAKALPLWQVETDRDYAMLISTSSGLWRYQIGDTVRFTKTNPYMFKISGRTKCFINAFGEELMVDNAEKGIAAACEQTGAVVQEYTAAPVFMDRNGKCCHQWAIEFRKEPPGGVDAFAKALDEALQTINSDYEAKRFKNITLQQLQIVPIKAGLFDEWLRRKGKLGGQHKIPRLSNERKIIEEILKLNEE